MGGYGSTRWGSHTPRQTVDDALSLPTRPLLETLGAGVPASGGLTWRSGYDRSETASIGYVFTPLPAPGRLRLRYTQHRGTEREAQYDYAVQLDTTPLHFGGVRWWFRCPLARTDRSGETTPCNRRCGKLYLPSGEQYFGCRICYDLTYRSCQEAHQFDGLYQRLAARLGCRFEDVRDALNRAD